MLAPLSRGISLSDSLPLGFEAGTSLAGGTPAYIPALLVLNCTMQVWQVDWLSASQYDIVGVDLCYSCVLLNELTRDEQHRIDLCNLWLARKLKSCCHVQSQGKSLTVARVHAYTMSLHERFWRSLSLESVTALFPATLSPEGQEFCMSWMDKPSSSSLSPTLALPTASPESALHVVQALRRHGIVADSRCLAILYF